VRGASNMITREGLFDYQIKRALAKFKKDWELEESGDDLYEKIWSSRNLSEAFGKFMLEVIGDYDAEIFEEV
jgi:hypothetical protein